MAGICRIIAAAALLSGVCGCGGSRFNWDGRWVGQAEMRGSNPVVAANLAIVDLRIAGSRYDLFAGGIPSAGKLLQSGTSATLEPLTVLDRPLRESAPEMKRMLEGVKLETAAADAIRYTAPGQKAIILKREAQP
jgi:hypothetical protein